MSQDGTSSRRQWWAMWAAVLLAAVILALLAEGAVRIRQWIRHGDLGGVEEVYTWDAELELRVPVAGGEFGPIHINSLGFRSPELAVPKPRETIRLAFLGGSTMFCSEVSSNEQTWPHLVWENIQQQWPDQTFDYLNASIPGYGVGPSLRNLRLRVEQHDPDVIIVYHATNDLSYHSFELAAEEGLAARPEDNPSWLSKHSLLWYLVEKNLRIMRQQAVASDPEGKLVFDREELARPFRRDLEELVRAGREVADVVVLITFAPRLRRDQAPDEQAQAAETSLYYMPYMSLDGLLDGFDAYNSVIRDVAGATGSVLVGDEAGIPGDEVHYVDSVHFTDAGSVAMAARVAGTVMASEQFRRLLRDRRGAQLLESGREQP